VGEHGLCDRVFDWANPELLGKNQIDNIERSWLDDPAEVSGIFNWMLEGLHRLGVSHDFTLSKTAKEILLEFKRTSDAIGVWMEDNSSLRLKGLFQEKQLLKTTRTTRIRSLEKLLKLSDGSNSGYVILQKSKIAVATKKAEALRAYA
jgi:hypothetical protein